MISEYIYRNRKGQRRKVGMLVATTIKDEIAIGYSLCCPQDTFNKDLAFIMAASRALSPHVSPCPPSIYKDVEAFAERCQRYFKDAHLVYLED